MRLIDADELEERIGGDDLFADFVLLLRDAPTVDAAEVVHGRWDIADYDSGEPGGYAPYLEVICNRCSLSVGVEEGQYGWCFGEPFPWKCCPRCGAKMDGGATNAQT